MRPTIVAALFAAGLLAGIIGSSVASDIGAYAISASDEGAWVLGRNAEVRYCWTKSNQFGGKDVECSKASGP